jgi:hypothetical protein
MKREKRSGMFPLRIYLPKKVLVKLEKEAVLCSKLTKPNLRAYFGAY